MKLAAGGRGCEGRRARRASSTETSIGRQPASLHRSRKIDPERRVLGGVRVLGSNNQKKLSKRSRQVLRPESPLAGWGVSSNATQASGSLPTSRPVI